MAVGQEKLGIDQPEVLKAIGLFGGGITGSGKTCGALSGSIGLISSVYSKSRPEDKEPPLMWKLGHKLDDKFVEMTEQHGGPNCSDIARVKWQDKESVREFYKNPASRRQICLQLVQDLATFLGQVIEEENVKAQ